MARQWIRACSLQIADSTRNIELAGVDNPNPLRIRFIVHYQSVPTPASLRARVYNLSTETIQLIQSLASKDPPTRSGIARATSAVVTLKAGYIENIGTIFHGMIYQLRVGYENSTDSYLDIFAADGDFAHNWGMMSQSFGAGYTAQDVWDAATRSFKPWQVSGGQAPSGLPNDASPRGKVTFGMTRDFLRDHANTYNYTWNIEGQQVQAYPKFAPRQGGPIIVNQLTGMVGFPEQTEQGITFMVLLNPAIRWNTLVQINDTAIARSLLTEKDNAFAFTEEPAIAAQKGYLPPLNNDGRYIVIYARYEGDTRGTPWYVHCTALSADPTATLPQAKPSVPIPPAIQGQ